jgi:hypothetical protein
MLSLSNNSLLVGPETAQSLPEEDGEDDDA